MKKYLLITFALAVAPIFAGDWGVPIMPVSEVKPGMTGTARTVFYNDKIEDFGVEVIDVMYNFYPKLDVILVRLLGDKATESGVVSGMSGSPVYIDGKLVGALSYRFGQFMKEPIGGVTPIESMLKIEHQEKARPAKISRNILQLDNFIEAALVGVDENFWANALQLPEVVESSEPSLQVITSPLIFSGFQPEVVRPFDDYFRAKGFSPMFAGSAGAAQSSVSAFEPGAAVSIVFLTGDLSIEATGTVTAVGDNKLLAFGHQLYNFGPIALPLAGTKIYTTLPSLMGSSKMATATGIVGTFLQDRLTGAYGDLTVQPKMIPVNLEIVSPAHETTGFQFKVANDPAFNNMLPLYMRTALIQAAYSARLAGEQNSCTLTGKITLTDGRSLVLDDFFSSEQNFAFLASGADAVDAMDLVTILTGTLMVNDFDGPDVASIDLKLSTKPGENFALIESVWQDKTSLKPGENLTLAINLRDNHGSVQKITRSIPIPKNISGRRLSIFVTSGAALTQYEVQVSRDKFVPQNFNHLLKILTDRRKTQNIYIQVRAIDNGLLVDGQELLDLPPSVANVMSTRSSGGVVTRMRDRSIYEEAIPTENVIVGAKRLSLGIESPSPSTQANDAAGKAWYN